MHKAPGSDVLPTGQPVPEPGACGEPSGNASGIVAGIVGLRGGFQHYAWGTPDELPAFFGIDPTGEPFAEWWLGAHPALPSTVEVRGTKPCPLDEAIAAAPSRWLGTAAPEFGDRLPFLLKILSVGAPLSLQVHPSLEAARAGFDRENAAGIALDAPERTYRDANHKPELIVALTPFSALCGFAPVADAAGRLSVIAGDDAPLASIASRVAAASTPDDLRSVVAAVLGADAATAARWTSLVNANATAAGAPHLRTLAQRYPGDPGVIVAALLNHVVLAPGEALFLDHGQLHAYLHGFGVELMANSDNVLRGGLTPKHIDIDELLRVLRPIAAPVEVLTATGDGPVTQWATPTRDFQLQRVDLRHHRGPVSIGAAPGPRLLVCLDGAIEADADGNVAQHIERAGALYLLPGADVRLSSVNGGVAFIAGQPAAN